MQVACPRCGPQEVAPGAPTCPRCGGPFVAGAPPLPPRLALPPRPTGALSVPAPPPLAPPPTPLAAGAEFGPEGDVGGRTMVFGEVIAIPPPAAAHPPADAAPSGTHRFGNVLPVPGAPAPPSKRTTSGRVLAHSLDESGERMRSSGEEPAPKRPSERHPRAAEPAAPATPPAAAPAPASAAGGGDDDDVGGRTMVFGDVIKIPPPPPGSAAAVAAAEMRPTARQLEERELGPRRASGGDGGGRALVLVGTVLVLGGVVFAAGFALSQSLRERQFQETLRTARSELEHGNAAGALLLIDATGGAGKVNADAQLIRARAALLTKKTNVVAGAVQLGLRDKEASAQAKATLQTIEGEVGLQSGDLSAAASSLKEATDADPKNVQAHKLLGEVYALQEQWDDARRELDQALGLDPQAPRAHLLRARVELHQGDREDAEKDLEVAGRDSNDLEARLARGELRLRDGDAAGALEDADAVAKAAPPAAGAPVGVWREARLLGARAKLVENDAAGAEEALADLAKAGVDDHEVRVERARAAYVAGRYDEAVKLYEPIPADDKNATSVARACEAAERALVLLAADKVGEASDTLAQAPTPPAIAFHAVGRCGLARALIELARGSEGALAAAQGAAEAFADARAFGGGPPLMLVDGVAAPARDLAPRAAIVAGRAAFRGGDETKAQAFFEKAVGADARSAVALVERGRELLRRGDAARATADLDAALQRAPDDLGALRLRGEVALQTGDLDRAATLLDRVAQAGARDPFVHYDLARALVARSQTDAALAQLERARELGLAPLAYADGRWRIALAKSDASQGELWLGRVIAERPYDLEALEARARLRVAKGDLAGATQDYRALRELAPSVEYERAVVRLYLRQAHFDAARAMLQGALARAPKDPELHALQGRLHLVEKRYPEAMSELREALALDENNAQATVDLALAVAYAGDDGLEAFVRRARALDPDSDPDARVLAAAEELAAHDWGLPKAWKAARTIAIVEPSNHKAHSLSLRIAGARKDWAGLLEAAVRCLESFPNDAEATAAQKLAWKNGAKDPKAGSTGGDDDGPPPPVAPVTPPGGSGVR